MFFPERIKNITPSDKVLEVGPGVAPYQRSDVLLDKSFDEHDAYEQRGGQVQIHYTKPLCYYDGKTFPFKDREFDYVICGQVLEHIPVQDLHQFLSELQRVAPKGYIETPRVFYEYLFNFYVHEWVLNYRDRELLLMPKEELHFSNINDAYYLMFKHGFSKTQNSLISDFIDFFMLGFEWEDHIPYRVVHDTDELVNKQDVESFKEYFIRYQASQRPLTTSAGHGACTLRKLLKRKIIVPFKKVFGRE